MNENSCLPTCIFSTVVIVALTEVFDGTVPSWILFPFLWNPYFKTDGKSLLILFLVKNFEEKEVQFLKEWSYQKLPSNDDDIKCLGVLVNKNLKYPKS